jgi:hypothetical protein
MIPVGALIKSFLLVYDRLSGALTVQEFSDAPAAMAARMKQESEAGPNTEVVVLSSDSESSLRQTHSRYFQSVSEILQNSGDILRSGLASAH